MKAFSSLAMFASLLILAACGGGGGGGGGAPASQSPFGTATGPAVEATIGPAGGTLSAGDGRASVSIPAGALAAATTISIQPVTNTAPGGRGLSYRFAPSGVVFSAPVQITFSFTDADLIGSSPGALGVGFQDEQGFWHAVRDTVRDDAAKKVSASSTHFSDWSYFVGWRLQPSAAIVLPGSRLQLNVEHCAPRTTADEPSPLMTACTTNFESAGLIKEWAVDGIEGGNSAIGTVTTELVPTATYTAPVLVIGIQTHDVTVRLSPPNSPDELLVSKITVVPGGSGAPSFSVTGTLDLRGIVTDFCPQTFAYISKPRLQDGVDFLIVPNQSGLLYSIVNIANSPSTFTWTPKPLSSGGTAQMDSDPEALTATDGSVTHVASEFGVTLDGTNTTGGCTAFQSNGQPAGQIFPAEGLTNVSFSFSTLDFVNGSQTVITDLTLPGNDIFGDPLLVGQWTWVISIVQ